MRHPPRASSHRSRTHTECLLHPQDRRCRPPPSRRRGPRERKSVVVQFCRSFIVKRENAISAQKVRQEDRLDAFAWDDFLVARAEARRARVSRRTTPSSATLSRARARAQKATDSGSSFPEPSSPPPHGGGGYDSPPPSYAGPTSDAAATHCQKKDLTTLLAHGPSRRSHRPAFSRTDTPHSPALTRQSNGCLTHGRLQLFPMPDRSTHIQAHIIDEVKAD